MPFDVGQSIQEELASLKQQIAQLRTTAQQTDANGRPTAAAVLAQEDLANAEKDYRSLLTAASTYKSQSGTSLSGPSSQQYILIQNADGSVSQVTNPNYQPEATVGGTPTRYNPLTHETEQGTPGTPVSVYQAETQRRAQEQTANNQNTQNDIERIKAETAALDAASSAAYRQGSLSLQQFANQIADNHNKAMEQIQRAQVVQGMVDTVTSSTMGMMPSVMDHLAPAGTQAALNGMFTNLANGQPMGKINLPTGQFPFDPNNLATQIALHAVKHLSPTAAQLTGAPAPGSSGTMSLPVQQTQQQQQAQSLPPPQFNGPAPQPGYNAVAPGASTT